MNSKAIELSADSQITLICGQSSTTLTPSGIQIYYVSGDNEIKAIK